MKKEWILFQYILLLYLISNISTTYSYNIEGTIFLRAQDNKSHLIPAENPLVNADTQVRIYARTKNLSSQDFRWYLHFVLADNTPIKVNIPIYIAGNSITDTIWVDTQFLDTGVFRVNFYGTPNLWEESWEKVVSWSMNLVSDIDTDGDSIYNSEDGDDDDDGVKDVLDVLPLDFRESTDIDGDGIGDNTDTDDDNDGISDREEWTYWTNPGSYDSDNDGISDKIEISNNTNPNDADTDNDGVIDWQDVFPLDSTESKDTDHDGVWNIRDIDDDNDNIIDIYDVFPLNSNETRDTDFDGIGNNADTDDDNDGIPDGEDTYPLDPTNQGNFWGGDIDTDGDSIYNLEDTDDDNDGVFDQQDAFPFDPNETRDTDFDGIGNNADTDDDNDGVPDARDAFPFDSSKSNIPPWTGGEEADTDGDGIKNSVDGDDDGDGVFDSQDIFPFNSNESKDTDRDGVGDNADLDDDNDGVPDSRDAFPLDATRSNKIIQNTDLLSINASNTSIGKNGVPQQSNTSVVSSQTNEQKVSSDEQNKILWGEDDETTDSVDWDFPDLNSAEILVENKWKNLLIKWWWGLQKNSLNQLFWTYSDKDSDGDGINDDVEKKIGTNPNNFDSDKDGLWDSEEIRFWTDPNNFDSDGDGLWDGQEVTTWKNPMYQDYDGDNISDFLDTKLNFRPTIKLDISYFYKSWENYIFDIADSYDKDGNIVKILWNIWNFHSEGKILNRVLSTSLPFRWYTLHIRMYDDDGEFSEKKKVIYVYNIFSMILWGLLGGCSFILYKIRKKTSKWEGFKKTKI